MNGKAGTISTTKVVCLALVAIMKDQVEHLNKIRVAATAIGTCTDEEAERTRLCVKYSS